MHLLFTQKAPSGALMRYLFLPKYYIKPRMGLMIAMRFINLLMQALHSPYACLSTVNLCLTKDMETQRPQVGVGLLVVRGEEILLGTRKGSHGAGELAGPGGHLELGESIEECALRELKEETGSDLIVKNLGFLCFINLRRYMPKHYAHVHMVAQWESGEPKIMEPDKQEGWGWYPIDDLPQLLFGTMPEAVEAYKTGRKFFEA